MSVSLKLQQIENNLISLLFKLISSQPLCRYIYYLDNDPLSTDKQDIDGINLINNNIILKPFDNTILTENLVKLFINPIEGNLKRKPIDEVKFIIDICCPHSCWIIDGQGYLRPFRIAKYICELLDGQNEIMGIGQIEVEYFKIFKLSENYSCLTLFLKVNTVTIKS